MRRRQLFEVTMKRQELFVGVPEIEMGTQYERQSYAIATQTVF